MTTDLAARITTGKPWPDGQPGTEPSGVVLLSAEDDPADTIRPRLDAAGADASRVIALTGVKYWDEQDLEWAERLVSLPGDTAEVGRALEAVDAALLVIDPLMAYLGEKVNEYQDKDIRRALAPLSRAAEATGAAIVLVRHFTKGGGANPVYRGGGSIGIIGAARIGYAVARDPQDETRVIVAATKANIAVLPTSLAYRLVDSPEHGCARVEWDGTVDYTAADLLREPGSGDKPERDQTVQWLAEYLNAHGGEAPAADVITAAEAVGIPKRTVQRARVRAGIDSSRNGFGGPMIWSLPENLRQAAPDDGAIGTNGMSAGQPIDATGAEGAVPAALPFPEIPNTSTFELTEKK